MNDLESQFDLAMRQSCDESRELGYFPGDFVGMLNREGGVLLAKRLVKTLELQAGLMKLASMGRLDLSIESLMLQPQFRSLFTKQELVAAEGRIWQAENEPKISGKVRIRSKDQK